MFHTLKHGTILEKIAAEAEQDISQIHQQIDRKSEQNEWRVLESYRKHKVSDSHFNPTTGYGYDDMGRDTLEKIYADVFGGKRSCTPADHFWNTCHFHRLIRCAKTW